MSKFNSTLDEFVYDLTLDGGCKEIDNGGGVSVDHYCFVKLGERERNQFPAMAGLEDGAVTAVAAIVHEDDQGFITVAYFDTDVEADARWTEIEDLVSVEDE